MIRWYPRPFRDHLSLSLDPRESDALVTTHGGECVRASVWLGVATYTSQDAARDRGDAVWVAVPCLPLHGGDEYRVTLRLAPADARRLAEALLVGADALEAE